VPEEPAVRLSPETRGEEIMPGWFSINIWWGEEYADMHHKNGFTRQSGDVLNILRIGPLHISFGIEGR
jgi:hypothetical protein